MRDTLTRRMNSAFAAAAVLSVLAPAWGATLTWNTGAGTWDTVTTNKPWSPGPTYFTAGDGVTFDSTLGSGGAIAIPSSVAPGSTTVTGALDYTFSGAGGITSGALTKSGSGVLTLSNAANSFSGVTLSGGELRYTTNGNRLGVGTINVTNSATLSVSGGGMGMSLPMTIASGAVLTLNAHTANAYAQYSGQITGGGQLRLISTGSAYNPTYVQNAANSFTGNITVEEPAIFTTNGAFGGPNKTIYLNSGWMQWVDTITADRTLVLGGASQQLRCTSDTLPWNGLITGGGFTFQGSGIALGNPNNTFVGTIGLYAGGTLANPSTLSVSAPGNINGNAISCVNPYNRLRITGTPNGNWTGNFSWGTYATFIDVVAPAAVVNWTGTLNGSGTLNKTGAGAFVVNDMAATGDVDIQGGTLRFNDTTTAGLGSYTVESGATLAGTGQMVLTTGKTVSVLNGGALAPGNSIGTLGVTGPVTFASGSFFDVQFGSAAGQFDLLSVTGNLSLNGATLRLYDTGTLTVTGLTYPIATYSGTLSGTPFGAIIGPQNFLYTLDYGIAQPGKILLTVIPEPASLSLLALAGMLALRRRR